MKLLYVKNFQDSSLMLFLNANMVDLVSASPKCEECAFTF